MEVSHTMDEHSERDLALLQGVWRQVRFEADGMADAVDDVGAAGALTTISGTAFGVDTVDGRRILEGRFDIDARREPPRIVWIDSTGADAGVPLLASYRLEGDNFVFVAADPGMPQPAAFVTRPGLTLRGFVRHR